MLFRGTTNIEKPNFLQIENDKLLLVNSTKFLGVWIYSNLTWDVHTTKLINTLQRNSHLMFRTKHFLNSHAKKTLYYTQIYSHLSYGISVWGPMIKKGLLNHL